MKAKIVKASDFAYIAELRKLEAPVDSYSLSFKTTWAGAKDPEGEHTVMQVTVNAEGLKTLRDIIDHEVTL